MKLRRAASPQTAVDRVTLGPFTDGSTQELDISAQLGATPALGTTPKGVTFGKPGTPQTKVTVALGPVTPASKTPVCTTKPQMQGSSTIGNNIICASGVWANAASIKTQMRRNGQPFGLPGQYSSWATPYTLQGADAGATFDGADTAANSSGQTATAATANRIVVAAPPSPTPTPSPSDPPTSLIVPAGWRTPNMFANGVLDSDFTKGQMPAGWVVNTGGDPAGANLQSPPTYFTDTPDTIRLDANGLGLGCARDTTLGGYQAGWVDTGGSYHPVPNQRISILVQTPPQGVPLWPAGWVRGQRLKFGDGGNYQEFDIFEILTWAVRQWYTTTHYWPANSPVVNVPKWPWDPGVDPSAKAAWVDFFWELLSDGPCVTTAYAGRVVAQQRALPSVFGQPPAGSINKLVLSNGASTGKWTGPALSSANDGSLPQFMTLQRVVVRD